MLDMLQCMMLLNVYVSPLLNEEWKCIKSGQMYARLDDMQIIKKNKKINKNFAKIMLHKTLDEVTKHFLSNSLPG